MDEITQEMMRTTVSFYGETYCKLEERKKSKGLTSIAQCIRELVELGLRVEEAANKKSTDEAEEDPFSEIKTTLLELKKLMKSDLNWSLETRLLARVLVESLPNKKDRNPREILSKSVDKATSYVSALMGEEVTE